MHGGEYAEDCRLAFADAASGSGEHCPTDVTFAGMLRMLSSFA